MPNNHLNKLEIIENKPIKVRDYLFNLIKSSELIFFLSKRDFVTFYKQTVLGPIWYILQPFLTSFVFLIIFNKIMKVSTDGIPPILFFFIGTVIWTYFSTCFVSTCRNFLDERELFQKIYFPRLIPSISKHLISFLKMIIQLLFFIIIYLISISKGFEINLNWKIILFPFLLLHLSFISLGAGMIVASISIRYRDIIFLLTFAMQLFMYACPIVYPFSMIPESYQILASLNPVAPVVQLMKDTIFFQPLLDIKFYLVSLLTTVVLIIVGLKLYLSAEKNFIDNI